MRIAAIGSRTFTNRSLAEHWLYQYLKTQNDVVVSGGAKGADKICASVAASRGYQVVEHIPDWDKYGKRAGFLRNEDIIKDSDFVLCFWDGISKGSANSLSIAKRLKKPTLIVYF